MGCDPKSSCVRNLTEISIHAPAWGATVYEAVLGWLREFQSTHPHGVRRVQKIAMEIVKYFNPRTRMGCDDKIYNKLLFGSLFQSTHPHGVRHGGDDEVR